MPETSAWLALLLATGAGLSTTVGSVLGIMVKEPGPKFMSFTLGFSAGVMILVSFVELLAQAVTEVGFAGAHIAFFIGMGLYFLIDALTPHEYIGQHDHGPGRLVPGEHDSGASAIGRAGVLTAIGITIHNFPEGMVTFVGAVENLNLGVAIAFAIAIHNIPEGLAISAPVYAATGSRSKAFLWSFLSGVSEIAGAGLAAVVLYPYLNGHVMGYTMALVAGIMVIISLDELIPVAKSFGAEHTPIVGVLTGMAVMAFSLWMLA
jgi:ZIP family zinc transporter